MRAMPFGTTGHDSSRVIFGAAALAAMPQRRADTTLATVRAGGINHIDTAAGYGDSELRLADFLGEHRSEFFVATKTGERTGAAARAQLEASLARMAIDRVDLIQLHNLVEPDEWATAFAPDGAVAALFAARDEGLCRFVGITGHGLRIAGAHLRSLAEAPFASVLFPWSHVLAQHRGYAADVAELRSVCVERGVAMQTIKSVARRRWPDPADRRFSWYEPLSDPDALRRAVEFVLADDVYFLNTSSDARLLDATIGAARHCGSTPPSDSALAADRTTHSMTPLFDGAALERI